MTDLERALYPFLDAEAPIADPAAVLEHVRRSILVKSAEVEALRAAMLERHAGDLARAAALLAASFASGGKVLAFGNGGSATDAQDLVHDLLEPPDPAWRALPAIDLGAGAAVLTAVANDVGFEHVFLRQVVAFGEAGDVAVGFSTSGESRSVLAAFAEARRRGLRTIGFSGNEGGRMAEPGVLDVVVVAPSSHVPRIQEAHATASHALLEMLQAELAERAP